MPVKLNVPVKVLITKDNYQDLTGVIESLVNKKVKAVCFSQVEILALSLDKYPLLVPAKQMLPFLVEAVKAARRLGMSCTFENLPLCLLPGEEDHFKLSSVPGVKMQFCLDCELSPRCGGVTKAQLIAEYGTQLLSWQFLFPQGFFNEQDIEFLDGLLLKSAKKA